MPARLTHPLEVATCIGCGARSRFAECADGCDDVPLDLVDQDAVDEIAAVAAALARRVAALRTVVRVAADDDAPPWDRLQEDARGALAVAVPPEPEGAIIEAWGCPACGRVDAPQPCIGVCIRWPRTVVDATRYRELAAEVQRLREVDGRLTPVVVLLAHVAPRPGQVERTRAALRARARSAAHGRG